jgi:hypothetical protein
MIGLPPGERGNDSFGEYGQKLNSLRLYGKEKKNVLRQPPKRKRLRRCITKIKLRSLAETENHSFNCLFTVILFVYFNVS